MIKLLKIEKTFFDLTETFRLYNAKRHRISGIQDLTLQAHRSFFYKHPYRYWFFIREDNMNIGTVYVQYDNSIGINLASEFSNKIIQTIELVTLTLKPLKPIPSVRSSHFIINVPSDDQQFGRALEEMGAPLIQKTYQIKATSKN